MTFQSIQNQNNSRPRGIPPEETFLQPSETGQHLQELHSSVHSRRTPEILQRSKRDRYKTKYTHRKSSSESYRCSANTISTALDSFTFCSDDHLSQVYGSHLKPEYCYQFDVSLAHGNITDSPPHCRHLFADAVESAGSAGRARCPPPPAQPRAPVPPRCPRCSHAPEPLPPGVPPCPEEGCFREASAGRRT